MHSTYQANAKIFKAFCDENRLRILEQLQSGEKCACTLLDRLTIGQSTLSHHMKILIDSGVVEGRKDGKWMHYSLSDKGTQMAAETLGRLLLKNTTSVLADKCEICKEA